MFVTDLVRNLAWSLRQSRKRVSGQDSVLPTDAIAPVAPTRRDRSQNAAAAAPARPPRPAQGLPDPTAEAETTAPAQPPHIDIKV